MALPLSAIIRPQWTVSPRRNRKRSAAAGWRVLVPVRGPHGWHAGLRDARDDGHDLLVGDDPGRDKRRECRIGVTQSGHEIRCQRIQASELSQEWREDLVLNVGPQWTAGIRQQAAASRERGAGEVDQGGPARGQRVHLIGQIRVGLTIVGVEQPSHFVGRQRELGRPQNGQQTAPAKPGCRGRQRVTRGDRGVASQRGQQPLTVLMRQCGQIVDDDPALPALQPSKPSGHRHHSWREPAPQCGGLPVTRPGQQKPRHTSIFGSLAQ